MKIRPEVQRFAEAMEGRLSANDHKGGWKECDYEYLLQRTLEEFQELDQAVIDGKPATEIRKEAADVANFAMMIADNYTRNNKGGPNEPHV